MKFRFNVNLNCFSFPLFQKKILRSADKEIVIESMSGVISTSTTEKTLSVLGESGGRLEHDAEPQRKLHAAVLRIVEEFWSKGRQGAKAFNDDGNQSSKVFSLAIGKSPHSLEEILDVICAGVVTPGVGNNSGLQFSHIPCFGLPSATIADFWATVMNKFPGVRNHAPGAVNVETAVLEWVAGLFGLDKKRFGGNLTTGTSIATIIALAAARDAKGLRGRDYDRCVIYLSSAAHCCNLKALRFLGLGECVVRKIITGKDQRISTDELRRQMEEDVSRGLAPFVVIGSLGTTATGAIDDMSTLSALARRLDAWFHVVVVAIQEINSLEASPPR